MGHPRRVWHFPPPFLLDLGGGSFGGGSKIAVGLSTARVRLPKSGIAIKISDIGFENVTKYINMFIQTSSIMYVNIRI